MTVVEAIEALQEAFDNLTNRLGSFVNGLLVDHLDVNGFEIRGSTGEEINPDVTIVPGTGGRFVVDVSNADGCTVPRLLSPDLEFVDVAATITIGDGFNGKVLRTTNTEAITITPDKTVAEPSGGAHFYFVINTETADVTLQVDATETLNGGTDPIVLDQHKFYLVYRGVAVDEVTGWHVR